MVETAPPSFLIPKERFYRDGFNVDDFLTDCARRSLDMEKVLVDVNHFNGILSSQLVALINKDYAEFVRLSSSLLGSETLTQSLSSSLHDVSDQVVQVRKVVNLHVSEIQQSIEEIVVAQTRVATLELFMHVQQALAKVETLLSVESPESLNFERLGQEFSRLDALVARGTQHDFIKEKSSRIEKAKQTLLSALEKTFREQLISKDRDIAVLRVCLQTYSALCRCDIPESLVRVLVVAPAVRRIVNLEAIEGGKRASCDGLQKVYAQLFKWASTEGIALVNTLGVVHGADFLTRSVFAEMTSALKAFGKVIFATGIPDTFHRNYSLSLVWLDDMEGLFGSVDQVQEFRASKSFSSWQRNWKIEVYFSLRSQEMVKQLRAVLDVDEIAPSAVFDGDFELGVVEASWAVAVRCWNTQTFLPGLQPQMLRFTLKVFEGMLQWVDTLANRQQQMSPATWFRVYHDANISSQKISPFIERVKTRFISVESHPMIDRAFEGICKGINDLLARCSEAALSRLSSLSSGKLQWVRQIPTRCLAGDVPSAPSNQVLTVLQPMSEAFGFAVKFAPKDLVNTWMRAAVADLDAHYSSISLDVLQTSAKTQSYIARRAGKDSGGQSQGMINIVTQFNLDVDHLEKKLSELGYADAMSTTRESLAQFQQQ